MSTTGGEDVVASRTGARRACGSRAPVGGLVLMELLLAVALLGLLAALAAPGFTAVTERLRVRSATEALRGSLHLARAEAFKRGGRVAVVRSPGHADCQATSDNAAQWRCGWKVVADLDEDGRAASGEAVLQAVVTTGGVDIVQTRGSASLRVNAWGQFNGLGALGFSLQSRTAPAAVAALCISAGGRIRARPDAARCAD